MILRAASLFLLLPLLAACGGKSSATPGEENQGGSHAGQGSGGSSAGGTGALGGSGATGGSGGAECARFDDEAPTPVSVLLINKTSKAIYLGQAMNTCGVAPLFTVADETGKVLPPLGNCRTSCAVLRKEGAGGCPAICLSPTSIKLEPGEISTVTWDALYRVEGSLPPSCLSYPEREDVKCDQAKRISSGVYQFSAVAGLELDCSMTTASGTCDTCHPDPNGGCSVPGGLIGGQMLKAEASATLDGSYGFFDAAPGPGSGAGDAAGALPAASVELIFTE